MKKINELKKNDLEVIFSEELSLPEEKFQKNLRKEVLDEFEDRRFKFKNIFRMKKLKFILPAGILSLIAIFLVGYLYVYPYAKSQYLIKNADANELLTKAFETNKLSLQISDNLGNSNNMDSVAAALKSEVLYTTRTTYEAGKAAGKCKLNLGMPPYDGFKAFTYEYSSYNHKENDKIKVYSKNVTLDENGNIIDYSLARDDYFINFGGGSYAVRRVFPPSVSDLWTYEEIDGEINETATEEVVKTIDPQKWGGKDAKVEGVEEFEGKEYYVVSSNIDLFCNSGSKEDLNAISGVRKVWVAEDSVLREETYLHNDDPSNLIMRVSSEFVEEKVSLDEVKKRFSFDKNVKIKDISSENLYAETFPSQEELDKLTLEYVKNIDYEILVPVSSDWKVENIDIQDALADMGEAYKRDRDFYPKGEIGDKIYKGYMSNPYIGEAEGSTYRVSAQSLSLGVSLGIGRRDAFSKLKIPDGFSTPYDITIFIDGEPQAVTVYDFTGNPYIGGGVRYAFERGGYFYELSSNAKYMGYTGDIFGNGFELKTLHSKDPKDYAELKGIIED